MSQINSLSANGQQLRAASHANSCRMTPIGEGCLSA